MEKILIIEDEEDFSENLDEYVSRDKDVQHLPDVGHLLILKFKIFFKKK